MMLSRDHYGVLGVAPDADADTIEASFRHLSRRYHPDINPGDGRSAAAFERIKLAYSVLSDAEARARYDREGRPAADPLGVVGPDVSVEHGSDDAASYQRLFRGLRDHAKRAQPQRGGDVHADVTIRLTDVERGRRTTVDIRRLVRCDTCAGSGRINVSHASPCLRCHGSGREVFGHGALTVAVHCADCGGEGIHRGTECGACQASGLVGSEETVAVRIPAGVIDAHLLRVAGGGHDGMRGGPAGDLLVTCRVLEDPRFERRGPHLLGTLQLTVSEAVLGERVITPTLAGIATVRVLPGTRNGQELRLRGHGLEMPNGRRGDLFLKVELWTPESVDEDAKRLIREFGERTLQPPRPRNTRDTVRR